MTSLDQYSRTLQGFGPVGAIVAIPLTLALRNLMQNVLSADDVKPVWAPKKPVDEKRRAANNEWHGLIQWIL